MKTNFFDIVNLVKNKLIKLNYNFKEDNNVIAGIVQVNRLENEMKCISLSVGTKATPEENIPTDGSILNDCHAEVLAKRGFMKYLYDELNNVIETKKSIFVRNANMFAVKVEYEFHLVVSESLCGDVALIASDSELDSVPSDHIAEWGRTGARPVEAARDPDRHLEGCNLVAKNGLPVRAPQIPGLLRTKPGRGSASHSMSCSDKLLRWVLLGSQGCLLSRFLARPVSLTSLIIPRCRRSRTSCNRAITQRLLKFRNSLHDPRTCSDLLTGHTSFSLPDIVFVDDLIFDLERSVANPSFYVMIWMINPDSCKTDKETIIRGYRQGFIKKASNRKKMSILSKCSFLRQFVRLNKLAYKEDLSEKTYAECKDYALQKNAKYSDLDKNFFSHFNTWKRTNRVDKYGFNI